MVAASLRSSIVWRQPTRRTARRSLPVAPDGRTRAQDLAQHEAYMSSVAQRPPRGAYDLIADGTVTSASTELVQMIHPVIIARDGAHEPLGQSRKDEERVDHEPPAVQISPASDSRLPFRRRYVTKCAL